MIIKFVGKRVIQPREHYCGLIVERKDYGLVARRYYKNEYDTYVAETDYQRIFLPDVHKKKTEMGKVREISRQLETGNYAISREAIELL